MQFTGIPGEGPGLPAVVVFDVATARSVGAQLRYNGRPRIEEIRAAVHVLIMQ
ncbi:hypothetical protein [Micromonospora sp. NPDC004551]|uniref:hypothetical protein n=1 Tax=Micromonospora sp. NPDC004551 TaxID=3154284 RepID=UPI0033BDB087